VFAIEYDEDDVTKNEWRVLHRIGSRDPMGIKRAMKQYNVDNIPDLVKLLEHHEPDRRFMIRLLNACGRVVGGYSYNPHKKEMGREFRLHVDDMELVEIKRRVGRAKTYDG